MDPTFNLTNLTLLQSKGCRFECDMKYYLKWFYQSEMQNSHTNENNTLVLMPIDCAK